MENKVYDMGKIMLGMKALHADRAGQALLHPKDFVAKHDGEILHLAIELLETLEPVTPQDHDPVIYGHRYLCGKCHHKIWRNNNFCPNCGRKVKWE